MWYVLVAFGVYLAMVGVLLAAAPWWVALGVVLCLLAGTAAAAPELGRALTLCAACATRSES